MLLPLPKAFPSNPLAHYLKLVKAKDGSSAACVEIGVKQIRVVIIAKANQNHLLKNHIWKRTCLQLVLVLLPALCSRTTEEGNGGKTMSTKSGLCLRRRFVSCLFLEAAPTISRKLVENLVLKWECKKHPYLLAWLNYYECVSAEGYSFICLFTSGKGIPQRNPVMRWCLCQQLTYTVGCRTDLNLWRSD